MSKTRTCPKHGEYKGWLCPKCHPGGHKRSSMQLKFTGSHVTSRASDHIGFSDYSAMPAVNASAAAANQRTEQESAFGLRMVEIYTLIVDPDVQQRKQLNFAVAGEYSIEMKRGEKFPAVVVFSDGTNKWLADGFHRVEAAKINNATMIWADVRPGNKRDAILYAAGSNAEHGLQRSNFDKRRAVETLLKDPEWCQWGNREIARRCRVSDTFVGSIRTELSANGLQITERKVERSGAVYTMRTESIGRQAQIEDPGEAVASAPKPVTPTTSAWAATFGERKPLLPRIAMEEVADDEAVPASWEGPAAAATELHEIALPAFVMDRDELMADLEVARHNNAVMRQNLEAAYAEIRELRAENERLRAMVPQMA